MVLTRKLAPGADEASWNALFYSAPRVGRSRICMHYFQAEATSRNKKWHPARSSRAAGDVSISPGAAQIHTYRADVCLPFSESRDELCEKVNIVGQY